MTRPPQTVKVLPLAQIRAHPGNVRDELGDLTDLACSIREHGILQPLTVTEIPGSDHYRLLDGHRRYAAAKLAPETKAPVVIRHLVDDPAEHTVVMLVTGSTGRPLSPVEKAKAYGRLRDTGLNLSEIARRVGVSPSQVSYYLNLLHLDEAILDQVDAGEIPATTAIATVREQRQADRAAAGTPPRGRPNVYHGSTHPLADIVSESCTHTRSYGGVGCGPCWEHAIRDNAIGGAA
jgi:ParB family chromosome partitioning protein